MSATPKTIQIYLPGGDPRGVRVADMAPIFVSDRREGKAAQAFTARNESAKEAS